MAKYKKKLKPKGRAIVFCFGSIAVIVLMVFTMGKCWIEIFDKYQEKQELEQELTYLKEKEEELQVDVEKLQNPDYVARYAREKYLYSKDGEIVLQMPEE